MKKKSIEKIILYLKKNGLSLIWVFAIILIWLFQYKTLPSNLDWDGVIPPVAAISPARIKVRMSIVYPFVFHGFLSLFFSLFSSSVSSVILTTTFIGLLNILFFYIFSKKVFKLSISVCKYLLYFFPLSLWLFFYSRTGSFYIMAPLFYILVLGFAYLSLKNKYYLLISGLITGISMINFYHSFLLLPVIIFLFLLFNLKKIFIKYLPIFSAYVLISCLTYVLLELLIEKLLGLDSFIFSKGFFSVYFVDRFKYAGNISGIYFYLDRIYLLFKNLFFSFEFLERYKPDEPITFIEGYPLLNPVISFLFFVGFLKFLFSKKDMFGFLLFFWLAVPLGVYSYASLSSPRYILPALPAFYLFSALGAETAWKKFRIFLKTKFAKKMTIIIFIFAFAYNFYFFWKGYFVDFKKRDYKTFANQYGGRQLANYMNKKFLSYSDEEKNKIMIVFDDSFFIPSYEYALEAGVRTKVLKFDEFKNNWTEAEKIGKDFWEINKINILVFYLFDPANIWATGLHTDSISGFFDLFSDVLPILPDDLVLSSNGSAVLNIYSVTKDALVENDFTSKKEAENFIVNGSFENKNNGWSSRVQEGFKNNLIKSRISAAISGAESTDGQYALRINAGSNSAYISQQISGFKDNTDYEIVFHYKNNMGYPIRVEILNNNFQSVLGKNMVSPNFWRKYDWNKFKRVFTYKGTGTGELRLYSGDFRKDDTFYFDGNIITTVFDDVSIGETRKER